MQKYVLLGMVVLGLSACSSMDERTNRGSLSGGSAETSPPITAGESRRDPGTTSPLGNQTSPSPTYRREDAGINCTPIAPCGPGLPSEKR